MRGLTLPAVIAVMLVLFGLSQPVGATTSPTSLVLPQSAAFAILGHSCGGIGEQQYATSFDSSSGFPVGDVHLTTTCSSGGRGSRPTTYTAWASVTWDFTGALVSDAKLSSAPTGVNPTLTAYDASGNEVYNSSGHAYLVLAPGYVPQPRLTGLSTHQGPASGGTSVTIDGTGFTAATRVDFGDVTAIQLSITSDTSITAVSPGEAPGSVDVTVTSPGGTSEATNDDQFTFVGAPTISALNPNQGSVSGGYTTTITGTYLSAVTTVTFGDQPSSFTIDSDTEITAYVPASDSGPDTSGVTVSSVGGTSNSVTFTYVPALSITVTPASGKTGTAVTIAGTGFAPGENVIVTYQTNRATYPKTVQLCSVATTASGTFTCKPHIPSLYAGPLGEHAIVAIGKSGALSATTYFDLT